MRANAEGNNELGQLARDINRTLSQLANTIQTLTGISGNVASAATEFAAVMTQVEVNAQQQPGRDRTLLMKFEQADRSDQSRLHAGGTRYDVD